VQTTDDINSLLLRVASLSSPPEDGSLPFQTDELAMSRLCDQLRALLPRHVLSDDEIVVIAVLHTGRQWFDVVQPTRSHVPQILSSLREKGIVEVESLPDEIIEETLLPPIAYLNKDVLRSHTRSINECDQPQPFASCKEYLLTWFHHVKRLHQFRENERNQHPIYGLITERSKKGDPSPTETERKFLHEEKELISRSQIGWERFPLEVLVRQAGLDATERNTLVFMLLNELENRHSKVEDVMTLISSDLLDGYQKDKYLKPSSRLRIFELVSVDDSPRRGGFRPRTEISMRPAVRHYLLTGEGIIAGITDTDAELYKSAIENSDDWLRYITMRQKILRISHDDFRADGDEDRPAFERIPDSECKMHPLLLRMLERIHKKESISGEVFPLSWLTKEHQLSEIERDILLTLLDAAMTGKQLDREDISRSLTQNPLERLEIEELLDAESKLVQQSLVRPVVRRRSSSELELDTRVRNFLLGYSEYHRSTVKDLIADFPLLSQITPAVTLDDLVVTEEVRNILRETVYRIEKNVDATLVQWGLQKRQRSHQDSDSMGATTILLSGASGVGKTHAGHCLAGSLQKSLVTSDCSRLLSYYVGESEQNVSKLFDSYEAILKRTGEDFPILMLNEVDQFFGKRSAGTGHSVDRMYNQMMNLFLERLESFRGILIATTNLVELIDESMSRRFSVKLVLGMPHATARYSLFKLHLPPTVPLAEDVDLRALADQYEFSGGQIALAVKQAATVAAIRGDMIRMGDLVAACIAEEEGAFDSKSTSRKRAVGFCATQPQQLSTRSKKACM
jgi:AAA+ superfamily predicted ATPase